MRRQMVVAGFLAILATIALIEGGATRAAVSDIGAVPIATGLDFPTSFTFTPNGKIFYGERFSGEIRIYDLSNGSDTLFFTVPDIVSDGARGLIGLALAPGYPTRPFVYAYATRDIAGTDRHQIVRMRDDGGTGSGMVVIWESDFVAGVSHPGGRILFGPDGKLYATIGDATDPANSQDLGTDAGKFLRMKPSGAAAPDNPFPGSRIWAYGIRSSFGFDFDPLTGFIWTTENGPTCNDEINRIGRKRNYGWGPSQTCLSPPPAPQNTNQDGPNPNLPQVWFTPTIAPTGLAFCVGCGIASAEGAFLFGAFNDTEVRQCTLNANRTLIVSTTPVYTHQDFVLSMERGPDGAVYLSDFESIWKLVEN